MAVDRLVPTTATHPGGIDGATYATQISEEVGALWNRTAQWLDSVAGTNTITAVTVPTLTAYAKNQMFWLIPANTITGAATVNIDGLGSRSIRDTDGSLLTSGELIAGQLYLIIDNGTQYRIAAKPASGGGTININYQPFTASGTWTKPSGFSVDSIVFWQLWGAGGGGGAATEGGGGGGGSCFAGIAKLSAFAATQAVSIAGTTAIGSSGASSTFFNTTGFGGGAGQNAVAGRGGGGGGWLSAGISGASGGTGGAPAGGASSAAAGDSAFGGGGGSTSGPGNTPGESAYGGGGGGGGLSSGASAAGEGGRSIYGGGGGGGGNSGAGGQGPGGTSLFGGNGGASAASGAAPGGGGGRNATGGRGELRVWVVG